MTEQNNQATAQNDRQVEHGNIPTGTQEAESQNQQAEAELIERHKAAVREAVGHGYHARPSRYQQRVAR